MGRKRNIRVSTKISRSPKQPKREIEESDTEKVSVKDQPQPKDDDRLKNEKPWAEKCLKWVKEQIDHPAEPLEAPPENGESDDDALLENHPMDDSAQMLAEVELPLRQRLKCFTEKEILNSVMYECEWQKCEFETIQDMEYLSHVEEHVAEFLRDNPDTDTFPCQWDLCDFKACNGSNLESHVHFHAYHNRIKTYGASLSTIISIPRCNSDSRRRNCIDAYRVTFRCEWGDCNEYFHKAQLFFMHVNHHIDDQFPFDRRSVKEPVTCQWYNCKQTYKRCCMGMEHAKRHTTEKIIGCYNCGTIFGTRLKYIDHCKRQVEYHNREYPCPQCDKLFATRQLMIEHSNIHNKKHGCTLCPIKFPSQKALSYHIRYRHVAIKPFQCHLCDRRTVTKADLDEHVLTHDERRMFRCEEFGCAAAYKCQKSLKRHVDSVHYGAGPGIYACHVCPNQYKAGANLSKHLIKIHQYQRPLGYNRFTYRTDHDGIFRLSSFLNGEEMPTTADTCSQSSDEEDKPLSVLAKQKKKVAENQEIAQSSQPEPVTNILIDKFETTDRGIFAIELKASECIPTESKEDSQIQQLTSEMIPTIDEQASVTMKVEPEPSTMSKTIDDFSVMKRYIKLEKPVVISFEETDSAGSVIRSETVQTTELNLLQASL